MSTNEQKPAASKDYGVAAATQGKAGGAKGLPPSTPDAAKGAKPDAKKPDPAEAKKKAREAQIKLGEGMQKIGGRVAGYFHLGQKQTADAKPMGPMQYRLTSVPNPATQMNLGEWVKNPGLAEIGAAFGYPGFSVTTAASHFVSVTGTSVFQGTADVTHQTAAKWTQFSQGWDASVTKRATLTSGESLILGAGTTTLKDLAKGFVPAAGAALKPPTFDPSKLHKQILDHASDSLKFVLKSTVGLSKARRELGLATLPVPEVTVWQLLGLWLHKAAGKLQEARKKVAEIKKKIEAEKAKQQKAVDWMKKNKGKLDKSLDDFWHSVATVSPWMGAVLDAASHGVDRFNAWGTPGAPPAPPGPGLPGLPGTPGAPSILSPGLMALAPALALPGMEQGVLGSMAHGELPHLDDLPGAVGLSVDQLPGGSLIEQAKDAAARAKGAVDSASAMAHDAANTVQGAVGQVKGVVGQVQGAVSQVQGLAQGAVGQVTGLAGQAVNAVQGAVGSVTGAAGGVGGALSGVASGVSNAVSGVTGGVSNAVSGVTGAVNSATGAVSNVTGAASGAIDGATGAVSNAASAASGAASNAVGAATGAVSNATGAVSGAASNLTGVASAAAGKLTGAMSSATEAAGGGGLAQKLIGAVGAKLNSKPYQEKIGKAMKDAADSANKHFIEKHQKDLDANGDPAEMKVRSLDVEKDGATFLATANQALDEGERMVGVAKEEYNKLKPKVDALLKHVDKMRADGFDANHDGHVSFKEVLAVIEGANTGAVMALDALSSMCDSVDRMLDELSKSLDNIAMNVLAEANKGRLFLSAADNVEMGSSKKIHLYAVNGFDLDTDKGGFRLQTAQSIAFRTQDMGEFLSEKHLWLEGLKGAEMTSKGPTVLASRQATAEVLGKTVRVGALESAATGRNKNADELGGKFTDAKQHKTELVHALATDKSIVQVGGKSPDGDKPVIAQDTPFYLSADKDGKVDIHAKNGGHVRLQIGKYVIQMKDDAIMIGHASSPDGEPGARLWIHEDGEIVLHSTKLINIENDGNRIGFNKSDSSWVLPGSSTAIEMKKSGVKVKGTKINLG